MSDHSMTFKAGTKSIAKIHCGWRREDDSIPDGEDADYCLLDTGKPVRFEMHQDGDDTILKAVYSFQARYKKAPIEEGRDIAMLDIPRKKVRTKF